MLQIKSAIQNQKSKVDWLLGAVFFGLYFVTLNRSVLPADNGEFQLVAWKLGLAHPPGYPLYTLAGWLFSRFFVSPALALNLLSAILASATLLAVSRTVRLLTRSTLSGWLAAALLGTSTTFWAQATTANIRMPTALFTALCTYTLANWSMGRWVNRSIGEQGSVTGPPLRHAASHSLVPFAIVFSLGLGHHLSLLFPGVFFVGYILLNDPTLIRQPRRWVKPLIVFALGLLVLLYLPIRGATGGTLADGEAMTSLAEPANFLDYTTGRGFEGDFFYFVNTRPDLLGDRVALLPTLFTFQFQPLVIVLVAWGALRLLWRDWKLAVMLLGGIVLHAFVAITYRAPQTVEYLLPAYVLLAVAAGYGLQGLRIQKPEMRSYHQIGRLLSSGCWLLAALLIILQFASGFPSSTWLRQNDDTRAYAESLLNDAPPNAVVLSNWHWANPMWYLQQVEGVRPDVTVQYVFPRGEPLAQSWLSSIDAGLKRGRPVVVDMFFRNEFDASSYFFRPISTEAWQVCAAPCSVPLESFTPLEINFDSNYRAVGFQPLTPAAPGGEPMTVLVAYQVLTRPNPTTTFFVHLTNPDGSVIGQADETVSTGRYHDGDLFTVRFQVAPLVDVKPGEYQLLTGAYTTGPGSSIEPLKSQGHERVPLTGAKVEPPDRLSDLTGVNLSGGVVYLGSTAVPQAVKPGDRVTIDLKFAAARPLLRDYAVSVQMTGQGWRAVDDSVPALGAIPTLKWIAGSEIVDRHVITIPANATPGPAAVTLSLYDAFTQEPLALLDAELIKQGPAIPLGTWTIKWGP